MKRHINNPISNPLSTNCDIGLVQTKMIKTILSCTTIEQLNNTMKWFSWVFNSKGSPDNGLELGIRCVYLHLFEIKKVELTLINQKSLVG